MLCIKVISIVCLFACTTPLLAAPINTAHLEPRGSRFLSKIIQKAAGSGLSEEDRAALPSLTNAIQRLGLENSYYYESAGYLDELDVSEPNMQQVNVADLQAVYLAATKGANEDDRKTAQAALDEFEENQTAAAKGSGAAAATAKANLKLFESVVGPSDLKIASYGLGAATGVAALGTGIYEVNKNNVIRSEVVPPL